MDDDFRAYEHCEIAAFRSFYEAASAETAADLGIRVETLDEVLALIASRVDVLALNRVLGLGLDQPATPEQLDRAIRLYREAGAPQFFIQPVPGAEPAELEQWLSARGFVHHNNWVRLVRRLDSLPQSPTQWTVKRIEDAHATIFGRIAAEAFGWPPVVARLAADVVGCTDWYHYMVFDGAEPAGTGALFISGDGAWIGMAATRPEYRGRGVQQALIARRLQTAAEIGCKYVVVETAEQKPDKPAPSHLNMIRFGFQEQYLRPNYLLRF